MRKRNHYGSNQGQNGGKGGGGGGQQGGRFRRPSQGNPGGGGRSYGGHDGGGGRRRQAASASREKYLNMARDALNAGDRVEAENYFQYADHYLRVLNSFAETEEGERPPAPSAHTPGQDPADGDAPPAAEGREPEETPLPPSIIQG